MNTKKILISHSFSDALRYRFTKYFRYDNSKYWKEYYFKKFENHETSRENLFADIIARYAGKNSLVVDVGSGYGFLAKELSDHDYKLKVEIVDFFEEMLVLAKKYLNNSEVKINHADILDLPFKNNSIDCISVMSVIEHFPYEEVDEDILPELHRVIKKNGYLFVHVPVKTIHSQCARWFRKYILNDLPDWAIDDDGDVTHKFWISPKEYINLITKHGFTLINYDVRMTRSNLRPILLAYIMNWLQKILNGSDVEFNQSLKNEKPMIQYSKKLKLNFALTTYFLFKRN